MDLLYDTGAMSACLSKDTYDKCFQHKPIDTTTGFEARAAGNFDLNVLGTVTFKLQVKDTILDHEFLICKGVNDDIMSIRLANQLQLSYDANSQIIWAIAPIQNSLVVHHRILLPAQSTAIISTKFQGSWDTSATYVATLHNPRTGFVVGGPALVDIKDDRTCQVAVINTAPFDIQLKRNNFIGAIEALPSTPVRPIDALPVASIVQPSRTPAFSRPQLQTTILARTQPDLREDLLNLLYQHRSILARGPPGPKMQDPRRLHLTEPLYQKQGKILLAHRPLIEETLDSWIRLGLVRKADSMFNTPLFCLQHPNGYRIVQDFRALNRKDHPEPIKFKKPFLMSKSQSPRSSPPWTSRTSSGK